MNNCPLSHLKSRLNEYIPAKQNHKMLKLVQEEIEQLTRPMSIKMLK